MYFIFCNVICISGLYESYYYQIPSDWFIFFKCCLISVDV